ncbi:hypothetical protein [Natronococcus occultus]|uniref:Uncharacterized protein n=1 Tax=Natronococcus occultus SP4 TaxID=694430 RepID=L0JUJ2_9EURY|nr:hypothetical protein [Natronococcus occultus]AGB35950.1 hypothetical protein Natoc_0068 [Natronococcus occultus SP4]
MATEPTPRSLAARDAIGLLVDRAVVQLVVLVVLGWWLIETGTTASGGVASPGLLSALSDGIGTLTVVAGTICYYGSGLALLGKLVHDAAALANTA